MISKPSISLSVSAPPEENGIGIGIGFDFVGFLPSTPPLPRLSCGYYSPWESIMSDLPGLIALPDDALRTRIHNLPVLSTLYLETEEEWRRAYVVLSFLTHAYIWSSSSSSLLLDESQGGKLPADALPRCICRPFSRVAARFDLPMTATYAALSLWNWNFSSSLSSSSSSLSSQTLSSEMCEPDNVHIVNTFTGTQDEAWFYAISVAIEAEGAKVVLDMLECFDICSRTAAGPDETSRKVTQLLRGVADCIVRLTRILDRMHERCTPDAFYHRIRPFFAASKGMEHAGLPNGILYDVGDDDRTWKKYSGGSNAQSSLIQLLDIFLGVEHGSSGGDVSEKQSYIREMRKYMPRAHREFLQRFVKTAEKCGGNPVRVYAMRKSTDAAVREVYVNAVENLAAFRDTHIRIVARYIVAPSRAASLRQDRKNKDDDCDERKSAASLCGTGGTKLVAFLKQCRDETKQTAITSTTAGAAAGDDDDDDDDEILDT